MFHNMQTVIISLLTSLFVSLFTFILGLKSGKNQADRSKVRQIYQTIYSQLEDLKRFIEDNRPHTWAYYEKEELGLHAYRNIAPINKLERNGELLLIKTPVAKKSVDLEKKAVNYGSQVFYLINNLHNVLTEDMSMYVDGSGFKKYQGSTEKNYFETANPTQCKSHIQCDYRDLLDMEYTIKLFERLISDNPCGIEFRLQTRNHVLSYMIYPESLTCSIQEFLQKMYEKFDNEITEFSEVLILKEVLLTEIRKLNKRVSKLAKEPFSFWETLFGAFGDIFR